MTIDQNNAPERIWLRVTDKTVMARKPSDADEYIRADRAAPEWQVRGANRSDGGFSALTPPPAAPEGQVRALPRAVGDDQNAGWTLPTDDLAAIKDQAYKKWGEVVSLETVEAIALEVERSILTAITPQPACQQEAVTVADAALIDLHYLANELSWDRKTRDISDRIIAALRAMKGKSDVD